MEFGLEKCANANFKRGQLTHTTSIVVDIDTAIKDIEQKGTYKYLGANEGDGNQHATMMEKIRKEYYRRVRMALKSKLNAVNRFEKAMLTMENMYHQNLMSIGWTYQDLKEGGLIQLELTFKTTNIGLDTYLTSTEDTMILQIVEHHEDRNKIFSIKKEAAKFKQELNLSENTTNRKWNNNQVRPQSKREIKATRPARCIRPEKKSQCMKSILRGPKTQT